MNLSFATGSAGMLHCGKGPEEYLTSVYHVSCCHVCVFVRDDVIGCDTQLSAEITNQLSLVKSETGFILN